MDNQITSLVNYYYSKSTDGFYVDDINTLIPQITSDKHDELLCALNSGCIIFDYLSYSSPQPSQFHT